MIVWQISIFAVFKSPKVGEAGKGGLLGPEEECRSSHGLTSARCPSGTERNGNFGMWSER